MPASLVDAASMLVIDVGAISTRAMLFDDVEGQYRFLACGLAPTTAKAPFHNVSEGVRRAIDQLQKTTGRTLVGKDEELIIPSAGDGSGVDACAAMISAGPPLKVVAVGLLEDVSLESARRLATTTYGKVVQMLSLNDRRKPEARINTILRTRPDLIVVAGGTEDGASQSVLKLLESVGLACYMMPEAQRPHVLFVGNQALKEEVKNTIGGITKLHFGPNIRPTLEIEHLDAAQTEVAKIYSQIRSQRILGVSELNSWARGGLVPTASGLGRVIRYVSKAIKRRNPGILGIDVGASSTVVAAAFSGQLALSVYPQLGLGEGLADLVEQASVGEITRWLTLDISDAYVREYLLNKALYPASLPTTQEDLQIEQALARYAMQSAIRLSTSSFPEQAVTLGEGLLPVFEAIIATGSVLVHAPSLAQSALMLLDGLQPTGVTLFILDQNHLVAALGAVAAINPTLAVQLMESNSLLHLGMVVSPVGNARPGTPILRIKIKYENDRQASMEVKQGSLEVVPLPQGQSAQVSLQPLQHCDIGMGMPGRGGGGMQITGGALGIIIDARGRPLSLPSERAKRHELVKKWLSKLEAK